MKIIALCLIMLSMSVHAALDPTAYIGKWNIAKTDTSAAGCIATPITIKAGATAGTFTADLTWATGEDCSAIGLTGSPTGLPVAAATAEGKDTVDITVAGDPKVVISFSAITNNVAPVSFGLISAATAEGEEPKTTSVPASATLVPKPSPVGNWNVGAVSATTAKKCCYPSNIRFSAKQGSTTQVSTTYTLPTAGEGCEALGVAATTPAASHDVTLADEMTWTDTVGTATAVWKMKQAADGQSWTVFQQIGSNTCELSLTSIPAPTVDYTKNWVVNANQDNVAASCCVPSTLNIAAVNGNADEYAVTATFDPTNPGCQSIGVNANNANKYSGVTMNKADKLTLDFKDKLGLTKEFKATLTHTAASAAGVTPVVAESFNLKETVDTASCAGTLAVAPTVDYTNNWNVNPASANVAASCCVPKTLKFAAVTGSPNQYAVTATFDPADTGCTSVGLNTDNAVKYSNVLVPKADKMTLDFGAKLQLTKAFTATITHTAAVAAAGNTAGTPESFNVQETVDSAQCAATLALPPAAIPNYAKNWNVNPASANVAASCCVPQTLNIAAINGDDTQYAVTATFDSNNAGCQSVGVTAANANAYSAVNVKKGASLSLDFGAKLGLTKVFSATVSHTAASAAGVTPVVAESFNLKEVVDTASCAATLVAPAPVSYAGKWDVKFATPVADKCCYPSYINFVASTDGTKYTVDAAFPKGIANCKNLGVDDTKLRASGDITQGDPLTIDFKQLGNVPATAKVFSAVIQKQADGTYKLTESVQLQADTAPTSCAGTVIAHIPFDYSVVQAFVGTPATANDANTCCIPTTLSVSTKQGDTSKWTVTAGFDGNLKPCQALGINAGNAASYTQDVPKDDNLALDFNAGFKFSSAKAFNAVFSQKANGVYTLEEKVDTVSCSATFAAQATTWPSHWIIEENKSNDKAKCCVPNHLKIEVDPANANNLLITPKFDPTSAGCTASAIAKKFANPISAANGSPLIITLPDSKGTITLKGTGEGTFALSQVNGPLTCTGTGKTEPINWVGSWIVKDNKLAADSDANTAKCCVPTSVFISKVPGATGVAPQYQVVANFPTKGDGCTPLGTAVKLDQNVAVADTLKPTQTLNSVATTLTLSKDVNAKLTIQEAINGVTCNGELQKTTNDWSGAYSVTPSEPNKDKCCYPMSNIQIGSLEAYKDQIFIQGRWDNSEACKKLKIQNTVFSSQVKSPKKGASGLLNLNEVKFGANKFNPSIQKDGTTGDVTYSYKFDQVGDFQGSVVECSAKVTNVNAASSLIKVVKWKNTWEFSKASDDSGCLPTGKLEIGYDSKITDPAVPKYSVKSGVFQGKACKGDDFDFTASNLDFKDAGPADFETIWNAQGIPLKYKTPAGADVADPFPLTFTLSYQLKQIIFSRTTTSNQYSSAIFTAKNYDKVSGFPGEDTSSGKKDKDSKKGVGAWVYVVVILVIVVLAIGGYYLYNRHKAAKLNQSLQDEYQKTLLKA